jgi:uncharacterized protein
MISKLFERHSTRLLLLAVVVFPYLYYKANTLPSNNSIENWLPTHSEARTDYERFQDCFGAEEFVLIGLDTEATDEALTESVCERIERLAGIRECWSPARLAAMMERLDVPGSEIAERQKGFTVSDDGGLIGVIAVLTEEGLADRVGAVAAVRKELNYCQLTGDAVRLAGAPVVVAELDRLGNSTNGQRYFLMTLGICLVLLRVLIREWKPAFAILLLTVWAINLTLTLVHFLGGEMNFILGALSIKVLVFTLAIAVHFLHYYAAAADSPDPLGRALSLAWKPCVLATLTTTIGLVSLTLSDIIPVRQFGQFAAVGSVVALFTGLVMMPAIITVFPPKKFQRIKAGELFVRLADILDGHRIQVILATGIVVLVSSVGLFHLQSKIEPLDFLPADSRVLADVREIQDRLANTDTIEAIVDLGATQLTFVEKLDYIRELESRIRKHPRIEYTMSAATFFPSEMPDDAWQTMNLLQQAQSHQKDNGFLSGGQRYWRISARIEATTDLAQRQALDELRAMTTETDITFTGITPLVDGAQREILEGFRESFCAAFFIITAVMFVSLRSMQFGIVAMVPNLTPLCLVFGTLGWVGFPIDIGMMMTGSIALGIAVDGTFHYLVRYQEQRTRSRDPRESAREALLKTGPPILQATLIAGCGMLALTMSSFGPTARFGYLMAILLAAALLGDLVLLPALLGWRSEGRKLSPRQPYYMTLRLSRRLFLRRRMLARRTS